MVASAQMHTFPVSEISTFMQNMPFPVVYLNQKLDILYFNDSFARFIAKEASDTTPIYIHDFMPEFQPTGLHTGKTLCKYMSDIKAQDKFQTQWTITQLNGENIITTITLAPASEKEDCNFFLYIHYEHPCVFCHQEANKTRDFINNTLNTMPLIMHIWSRDLQLIDCSNEVTSMFGIDNKDEYKKNYLAYSPEYQVDGLSKDLIPEYLEKAFKDGSYTYQWLRQNSEGKTFPTEETLRRVVFQGEEFILGYTKDISAVTDSIKNIIHMEERTRAILDATPMAILLWDKNFKLRDTNMEALRMYDYEDKYDFLQDFEQTLPVAQPDGSSSANILQQALQSAFETGYHHLPKFFCRDKSGQKLPVEMTTIRIVIRDETMVIIYLHDLREISQVLEAMQSHEQRIQAVLDLSPLGINVWDKQFTLLECNKAIIRLYGFKDREDYLENRRLILPETQADGQSSLTLGLQKIEEAFALGQSQVEMLTKDMQGNAIPVDLVLKSTQLGQQEVVIGYVQDLRNLKAMLAEIHAVEEDLRSARDVAVRSARAKSEFLANMSHEIRTPLNGVLGLLHLLDKTPLTEHQQGYVNKTIFSAENLLRIINDILDFSKIDAGKLEMENIPFALEDVASELKMLFEPQANNKKLALTFKYDKCTKHMLLGDPLRIKQVFFNLIGNAIKFTEQGGITITMTGKEESPGKMHCLFSVRDSGIGMNEEQRLRLFSAFMQADTSVTRKYGGTGLGLVIAQRIARLMQGDLWVESQEGEGSTFFFSTIFDFANATDMAALEATAPFEQSSYIKEQNPAPECVQIAEQVVDNTPCEVQPIKEPQKGEEKFHILLVEDNEINQLIAEELLKNAGHTVDIANNGQEGLDLLEKNTYNIILMDIQMPVLDGLSTVAKIREDARFTHMPVIAMSAHAMTGDREISLHHGMNEHITKPISPQILYETVNTWALRYK